jgi:hypothetical protein
MDDARLRGGLYGNALGMEGSMAADQGFIYQPTYIDEAGNAIAQQNLNQAKSDSNWGKGVDVVSIIMKALGLG